MILAERIFRNEYSFCFLEIFKIKEKKKQNLYIIQGGRIMIYTITFNPALDYVIKTENFKNGKINKSKEEYIFPGGKGINVSIVLKTLGQETTAMGFIAGFVGKEIEEKVQKYGVKTDFIKIENNNSRINVKILEENKGKNGNIEKEETLSLIHI